MALPIEKNKLYTYAEYKRWPEGARYELIDGTVFDMSPAPGMTHQKVSMNLSKEIANFFEEKPCLVFCAPFDVFFPDEDEKEEDIKNIVQPDISIICDESKLSEKGCTGAPDVVIELISPSTASHDQIAKLRLYEKYGVREYWIVHPIDRIVWKYVLENGVYEKPELFDYKGKPSFKTFPDLEIDLYKAFDVKESDYIYETPPGYVRL